MGNMNHNQNAMEYRKRKQRTGNRIERERLWGRKTGKKAGKFFWRNKTINKLS